MAVAKILRATGAADKITHELARFRELFYQRTVSLFCDGAFFSHFLPIRTVDNAKDPLTTVSEFFHAEATTRCVVSGSELAFVNLSTPETTEYYGNLRILLSALDFPFVFLREYADPPVEPSPCDGFREALRAFLRAHTVLLTSLRTLCTHFSFHVLDGKNVIWDGESLQTLHGLLDRADADAAALAERLTAVLQGLG